MKTKAAVAWQAGKPLTIETVDLQGPKFGEVLAKTRKKLDEAASQITLAERRTRVMTRELRSVEALPDTRITELLPGLNDGEEPDEG